MNLKDFLQSGIIEMYCMGIVSEQEKLLVKDFSERFEEVRKEIDEINRALQNYATSEGTVLQHSLKERIMNHILAEDNPILPAPRLNENQDVNFWLTYLIQHKKNVPQAYEEIYSLDLPSDERQVTYAVWAKKGAAVEESHDSEDEYLFMLKGSCKVICNGVEALYHTGDLVYIPKNVIHKAISFSDDMLLIGQRIAA